jgi:hypothetical protein
MAVASAGVTQAEWDFIRVEARRQAQRANVSEAALLAAAEATGANLAGSRHFNALSLQQAILDQLADQADQISELQRRLDAATGDADPQIAHTYAGARTALNEGRLADADNLLALVEQRDLATMQQADAEAERRRLRVGNTIAARGQVADVQADYFVAANFYARAAATVPQSDLSERWSYLAHQASALRRRGEVFNEAAPLYDAVKLYRDAVLPLAPRETRPADWAATQNDMGVALEVLGARGDGKAIVDAIAAFSSALEVFSRQTDPINWASAKVNFGNALLALGDLGDDRALNEALAAFRDALTVDTRQTAPAAWARDQNSLSVVLERLGARGDIQTLRGAAAAANAALEVWTRDGDPAHWAIAQSNLGAALLQLGANGDDQALHNAINAFRFALQVDARERDPAAWARDQNNLGAGLEVLGERGDDQALRDAAAAYRAALTVDTRESAPVNWARDQYNLGVALRALGERGDDPSLRDAIAAFRNASAVDVENSTANWARDQYNLGLALAVQADRGDAGARSDALHSTREALDFFRRSQNADAVQLCQNLIARLAATP